jgi:hypothetical protein
MGMVMLSSIIYDRFNKTISLLFEIEVNPATKSVVTESYVVECIFLDDIYSFTEFIATLRKGRDRKHWSAERGAGCIENARDHYLCDIADHRILEYAMVGEEGSPCHPNIHESKHFTNIY